MTDNERLQKMSRKEIQSEIIHLSREQEEYAREVLYLKEQLADRDKTIASLKKQLAHKITECDMGDCVIDVLHEQNTIMLSTLKRSIFFISGGAPQQAEKLCRGTIARVEAMTVSNSELSTVTAVTSEQP